MNRFALSGVAMVAVCSWIALDTHAQDDAVRYLPRKDSVRVPNQPYERYFTRDRFGREITFYLSEATAKQEPLPLVVFIQGSGCTSLFIENDGRVVPAGGHIVVQEVAQGKARVLIVEKPGVKFLAKPGTEKEQAGSAEFRREHTLDRWAEAVEAATRAAGRVPGVQPGKTLVIGHSEGGLVACRVARELPDLVTHVASLAGGGPSQLFDLVTLARKGNFFRGVSEDPEVRVRHVLDSWRAIQADPQSTEKLFFGFAYRRWASFLASSPMEELTAVRARIYVAQGMDDDAVDPAGSDVLDAQLRARGKELVYDRVSGADHSFRLKGRPGVDGWQHQIERIVNWFLAP